MLVARRIAMLVVFVAVCCMLAPEAQAFRGRRHSGGGGGGYGGIPAGCCTTTAADVAVIMAKVGRVGHWGGNSSYEGCGMSTTQAGAYNICCYANAGLTTVDVGYAQGANGMWYCCRRYR